jgi:hypothetical protein
MRHEVLCANGIGFEGVERNWEIENGASLKKFR